MDTPPEAPERAVPESATMVPVSPWLSEKPDAKDTEPLLPENVFPDVTLTRPLTPVDDDDPEPTNKDPVDSCDVPLLSTSDPDVPNDVLPLLTNSQPELPLATVPELNSSTPLLPTVSTLADTSVTAPDEDTEPPPVEMATEPPESNDASAEPAERTMEPVGPAAERPTTTDTDPAEPEMAVPVFSSA